MQHGFTLIYENDLRLGCNRVTYLRREVGTLGEKTFESVKLELCIIIVYLQKVS